MATVALEDLVEDRTVASGGLVDLGVFSATDLLDGPTDLTPLIGAPAGSLVQLTVGKGDFVQSDGQANIGVFPYGGNESVLMWTASDASAAQVLANGAPMPHIEDGSTFYLAILSGDPTVGAIHLYALVVKPGGS